MRERERKEGEDGQREDREEGGAAVGEEYCREGGGGQPRPWVAGGVAPPCTSTERAMVAAHTRLLCHKRSTHHWIEVKHEQLPSSPYLALSITCTHSCPLPAFFLLPVLYSQNFSYLFVQILFLYAYKMFDESSRSLEGRTDLLAPAGRRGRLLGSAADDHRPFPSGCS